ncbi:unnamed protein product [Schistocephalus solidus]|uniref:Uncharacterized protein n=1 Tax=Schistocephalus solidus TaxID=70667 RepID=A0A183SZ25_SCHSO|nr:unnamed protein product [Schistocephalus solidus]
MKAVVEAKDEQEDDDEEEEEEEEGEEEEEESGRGRGEGALPEVGKEDLSDFLKLQDAKEKQKSRSKLLTTSLQKLHEVTAGRIQPLLVSGGKELATSSPFGSLSYVKLYARQLKNLRLGAGGNGTQQSTITLPDLTDFLAGEENVVVQVTTTSANFFQFANARGTEVPYQSETLGLSIFADGRRLPVSDLQRTFKINISKSDGSNPPPFTSGSPNGNDDLLLPPPLIAVDGSTVYQPLVMLSYVIEEPDFSFHLQFKPQQAADVVLDDPCPQYLIFARHIYPPDLTVAGDGHGALAWAVVQPTTAVCEEEDTNVWTEALERNYTFFLNNAQLNEGRREAREISEGQLLTVRQLNTFYVGYRQLRTDEKDRYSSSRSPPRPYPYQDQINVTVQIRAFISSCAHLADGSVAWATSGCNFGSPKYALAATTVEALVGPNLRHNRPAGQSSQTFIPRRRVRNCL